MDIRRFFTGSTRLTESFEDGQVANEFGMSFDEAFNALSRLCESDEEPKEQEEATEEPEEPTEESDAADAEEPVVEEPADDQDPDDAEGSDESQEGEQKGSFQPVYKDIKTIQAKANDLTDTDISNIENPSFSLEGEADKLYDSLINLLNNTNLPSAYEILNIVAGDDKLSKLLNHGFSAPAGEDKQVKVSITPNKSLPTKSLVPTQNVVVVSNSLNNLVNGYYVTKDKTSGEDVQNTIDYSKYFTGDAPVPQPFVYQAGNKNYIIDGHHRWSQAYCMNPYGTLKCTIITGPDIGADAVLKNFQAAIAVDPAVSKLPIGSGGGMNLFQASITDLGKTVSPMTEETAERIVSSGDGSEALNNVDGRIKAKFSAGSEALHTAKALLISNALLLKRSVKPGKNNREIMPQADIKKVSAVVAAGALPIEASAK